MTVETVVVGLAVAAAAVLVVGTALVLREWARVYNPRCPSLAARYRRGRHQAPRPPVLARVVETVLDSTREMATASALLKGIHHGS